MNKIYIAGPFFNELDESIIEKIKATCSMLDLIFYSPKDEIRFSKDDHPDKAKECFDSNLKAMNECDFMIAYIDGYDPGTLVEMGYLMAHDKPILAFSNVPERKMNLMLSQGCIGFSNGFQDLVDKLVRIKSGNYEKEKYTGEQE